MLFTANLVYAIMVLAQITGGGGEAGLITVVTTRPETVLGDTGVAVNSNDERLATLVGQFAVLPVLEMMPGTEE